MKFWFRYPDLKHVMYFKNVEKYIYFLQIYIKMYNWVKACSDASKGL